MRNAHSEHNAPRREALTILGLQLKALPGALQMTDVYLFQLGHHPLLKGFAVSDKHLEGNGHADALVGLGLLLIEVLQGKRALWIVQVARVAV